MDIKSLFLKAYFFLLIGVTFYAQVVEFQPLDLIISLPAYFALFLCAFKKELSHQLFWQIYLLLFLFWNLKSFYGYYSRPFLPILILLPLFVTLFICVFKKKPKMPIPVYIIIGLTSGLLVLMYILFGEFIIILAYFLFALFLMSTQYDSRFSVYLGLSQYFLFLVSILGTHIILRMANIQHTFAILIFSLAVMGILFGWFTNLLSEHITKILSLVFSILISIFFSIWQVAITFLASKYSRMMDLSNLSLPIIQSGAAYFIAILSFNLPLIRKVKEKALYFVPLIIYLVLGVLTSVIIRSMI